MMAIFSELSMFRSKSLLVIIDRIFVFYLSGTAYGGRRVIYRGPQSYAGYKFRRQPGRPAVPPRTYYRPKPIDDVKLHGRRRNDPTYRQGLSEFAGLMDAD
ncbi:hypothetical protein FBUS_10512 [Fasciolopsis buskii]|uniref:Uncharacterized protein n=1 Tax=Fasciolopsis buskii TaxID=27845 RepID=A0A8E0RY99_9TREM|nr:hypothetical protein FBUS_10512 [Fasciolopsis buski]